MAFLVVGASNEVLDILDADTGGAEVTNEQMQPIIKHKYGHTVFDFIGGAFVLNQARQDELELNDAKAYEINNLVENEKELIARERLALPIQAINNATSKAELAALGNG